MLRTPQDFGIYGVVVDEAWLAEQLPRLGLGGAARCASPRVSAHASPLPPHRHAALCQTIESMLSLGASGEASQHWGRAALRTLTDQLLGLLVGGAQDPVAAANLQGSQRRLASVMAARSLVAHPLNHAISVEALCAQLHLTPRTLQNHFQSVVGESPADFLRAVRLNACRRRLRASARSDQAHGPPPARSRRDGGPPLTIGPMRILGIDPGLRTTGFGVIDSDGSRLSYVASGTIRTDSLPNGDLPGRLGLIFAGIREVVARYEPQCAAVEIVFVNVNPQSTLLLGQARGAALAALVSDGLVVSEYTALQMKKAVVGHGLARKEQVQAMVARLLSLPGEPGKDAADALGVAVCQAHAGRSQAMLAAVTPLARRAHALYRKGRSY